MESTITQRLEMVRSTLKISQNEFCRRSKLVFSTYNMAVQRHSDVGFSTLNAVLCAFPTVSAEWLMRGKGTMFTSEHNNKVSVIESTFGNHTIIANTVNQASGEPSVALLQVEVDRLREENRLLIETNAQLVSDNGEMAKNFGKL